MHCYTVSFYIAMLLGLSLSVQAKSHSENQLWSIPWGIICTTAQCYTMGCWPFLQTGFMTFFSCLLFRVIGLCFIFTAVLPLSDFCCFTDLRGNWMFLLLVNVIAVRDVDLVLCFLISICDSNGILSKNFLTKFPRLN